MSNPLCYNVDERLSLIKDSIKQISENFNTQDLTEDLLATGKKPALKNINSLNSEKASNPTAYVSDYIAFGSESESDSSLDELSSSQKAQFFPLKEFISESPLSDEKKKEIDGIPNENYDESPEDYNENHDLDEDFLYEQEKCDRFMDYEKILEYEKRKNMGLEKMLEKTKYEINQVNEENKELIEILDQKDKELEEYKDVIDKLKGKNEYLSNEVQNYQDIIRDFETMCQEMKNSQEDKQKYYEADGKNLEDKERIEKLMDKVKKKDSEIQKLIVQCRKLIKNNELLEKTVQRLRERAESPDGEKILTEKVKELKTINASCQDKMSMRVQSLLDTEQKLQDLETIVHDYCEKKPAKNSSDTSSKILNSLQSILRTKTHAQMISKITDLLTTSEKNLNLTKKLQHLIQKHSPSKYPKFQSDKKLYLLLKKLLLSYLPSIKEPNSKPKKP